MALFVHIATVKDGEVYLHHGVAICVIAFLVIVLARMASD